MLCLSHTSKTLYTLHYAYIHTEGSTGSQHSGDGACLQLPSSAGSNGSAGRREPSPEGRGHLCVHQGVNRQQSFV